MNKYILNIFKLSNDKQPFLVWLNSLDKATKKRILLRLSRIETGNFGDFKKINENLFELRFNFGSGYRIYYTIKNNIVIILLVAGDKSSQNKDIIKANEYIKILKDNKNE